MAPFNHLRPLLLLLVPLLLIPLGPHHHAAAAAAHHHPSPGSTHAQHHRHSSPMITATAPSIITKDHESEESQPLLALEPFSAAAAVAATGGAEPMVVKGAAATAADPARRNPRRATTPPPRSFSAAADLASLSQPQPRAEAGRSAPEVGAPRVDEPATDLYSRAANAARLAASGTEERLLQLDRVLTSLGYNEMASAVALFARSASPTVARWRGPVTVFAAPDVLIQGSCPAACSRRHLLLGHLVLGYFPFAALVLAPAVELPSAAVGFCVHVASGGLGSLDAHRASLYVNGVEVSHPDLYNDGRYVVVHGLRGVVQRPLATASCIDGSRRRHWHICPRTAASSGPGPSVMRLMILEAIACLHVKGYSTVALVMSNSFAELQKLEKLTVFALDDGAIVNITSGDFGHIDYATVVLFHIIPGYRLTHADLLHLGHVTRLPTLLAGEDQNFGISYAEEAVTEPDMVTSSRLAIHGIGYPLSPAIRLTGTNDAIRWTTTDYGRILLKCVIGAVVGAVIGAAIGNGIQVAMRREEDDDICSRCYTSPIDWLLTCCGRGLCATCLPIVAVNSHTNMKGRTCRKKRGIVPVWEPAFYEIFGMPAFLRATLKLPELPWFLIDYCWLSDTHLECTFASLDDCRRGGQVIGKKKVLYVVMDDRMVRASEIDPRALLFWIQG